MCHFLCCPTRNLSTSQLHKFFFSLSLSLSNYHKKRKEKTFMSSWICQKKKCHCNQMLMLSQSFSQVCIITLKNQHGSLWIMADAKGESYPAPSLHTLHSSLIELLLPSGSLIKKTFDFFFSSFFQILDQSASSAHDLKWKYIDQRRHNCGMCITVRLGILFLFWISAKTWNAIQDCRQIHYFVSLNTNKYTSLTWAWHE